MSGVNLPIMSMPFDEYTFVRFGLLVDMRRNSVKGFSVGCGNNVPATNYFT